MYMSSVKEQHRVCDGYRAAVPDSVRKMHR